MLSRQVSTADRWVRWPGKLPCWPLLTLLLPKPLVQASMIIHCCKPERLDKDLCCCQCALNIANSQQKKAVGKGGDVVRKGKPTMHCFSSEDL
jgi:hypothetical protein